jgi:hypothetical protein
MKEREARGASLFCQTAGYPTSRQPHPWLGTAGGADAENERTAMARICRPDLRDPFLGGGDKQPVELLADVDTVSLTSVTAACASASVAGY